jgi:hypothetical protein
MLQLLLAWMALARLTSAQPTPVNASSCTCPQKTLVNVDFLGLGYDVIFGNPHSDGNDPGFRQQIMSLSYDQRQLSAHGKWFVPDGTHALRTLMCSYKRRLYCSSRHAKIPEFAVGGCVDERSGERTTVVSELQREHLVQAGGTRNIRIQVIIHGNSSEVLAVSSVDRFVCAIHRHAKSGKCSSLATDNK